MADLAAKKMKMSSGRGGRSGPSGAPSNARGQSQVSGDSASHQMSQSGANGIPSTSRKMGVSPSATGSNNLGTLTTDRQKEIKTARDDPSKALSVAK